MTFFNRAIVSSFITAITISDTRFRLTDGTFRIRDRRSGFGPGFGERVHKYEVFFTTGSPHKFGYPLSCYIVRLTYETRIFQTLL